MMQPSIVKQSILFAFVLITLAFAGKRWID